MIDVRPAWLAILGLSLGCACSKRDASGAPPEAGASASVQGRATPAARCRSATPGARFNLGVSARAPDAGPDGEDDDEFLPFSIELGRAAATDGGFAVGALRSESEGMHALVLLVSPLADGGRSVDLGRVYGDVEPPVLAARGSTVLLSVSDSNPQGRRLSLVKLEASRPDGVVRGGELEPGRGFQVHDIEIGPSRALVVWDQQASKQGPSGIWGASVELSTLVPGEPRRIGGEALAAESPRLVRRPGGFWLVFVEHTRGSSADAGVVGRPAREEQSELLVDLGSQSLGVLGLDEQGNPSGSKLAITEPNAHVLSFDVAPTVPGGLVLAWRDDPSGPGAERGQVHGAIVGPDGSVSKHLVDADEVGAGTPSLVPGDRPWLALGGLGEATRLARVDVGARTVEPPLLETALRGSDVLAASGTRLLLAHPRGMGVEFSVADCSARPGSP